MESLNQPRSTTTIIEQIDYLLALIAAHDRWIACAVMPRRQPIRLPDDTIAQRYHGVVIQSFADAATEKVWLRERAPRLGLELQRGAQKKLRLLNAADERI